MDDLDLTIFYVLFKTILLVVNSVIKYHCQTTSRFTVISGILDSTLARVAAISSKIDKMLILLDTLVHITSLCIGILLESGAQLNVFRSSGKVNSIAVLMYLERAYKTLPA